MGLVVVVLVGGLLVGRVAGGSFARLAGLRLTWPWLVLVAAGLQLAGTLLAGATGRGAGYAAGLVGSAGVAAAFLARNRRVPGVPLVALGLLLNAVVVALNGAMPVSLYAAARAGTSTGTIAVGADPRHELAGAGTRVPALGDDIPVPLPLRPEVLSPGDVLVAAGLGLLVVAGMRRRDASAETDDGRVEWTANAAREEP